MSFNAKDMTQGGQIASMRIRMFSQIANIMLYCLFIFFWILVGLVLWIKISWQTFVNGCIYWWCTRRGVASSLHLGDTSGRTCPGG